MRFFIACLFFIVINGNCSVSAQDFSIEDLEIVIEAKKTEIQLGETYEALIGFNQIVPYGFSIAVNGRYLGIKNGQGRYTASAQTVGEKSYTVRITLKNRDNGSVQVLTKKGSYYVKSSNVEMAKTKENTSSIENAPPLSEYLDIVVEAEDSEILLGEQYKARIRLNQALPKEYSCSVSVGGSSLVVTDNQSLYTASSTSVGRKYYTISVSIKDSEKETIKKLSKKVSYRIKSSGVSIAGTKMNVLFVGVDNPIVVTTSDIAPENLKVSISGATVKYQRSGHYVVTCRKSGEVNIVIRDVSNGRSYPFKFRAKHIPNPIVTLGKLKDGTLSKEELAIGLAAFSKEPALTAWLENFDFDARCEVTRFSFLYYRKGKLREEIINEGAVLQSTIKVVLEKAQPGDLFLFTAIEGACLADEKERQWNSLVLRIKE
ncbi:MAG: GldM family protein [Aureispira sp.]